jgi:hypothetical protein
MIDTACYAKRRNCAIRSVPTREPKSRPKKSYVGCRT